MLFNRGALWRGRNRGEDAPAPDAYGFVFKDIDGVELPLSAFRGRPVLIVNTATGCGFAEQFESLQALWERHRRDGLAIIAASSNDFGGETAAPSERRRFVEVNFGLSFPLTETVRVSGAGAHPFFAWAACFGEAPRDNFYKYLVGVDGRLVYWADTTEDPSSARLRRRIARELRRARRRGPATGEVA